MIIINIIIVIYYLVIMRRYIFNIARKLLPRISETEKIALQSGTVSLDRDIM